MLVEMTTHCPTKRFVSVVLPVHSGGPDCNSLLEVGGKFQKGSRSGGELDYKRSVTFHENEEPRGGMTNSISVLVIGMIIIRIAYFLRKVNYVSSTDYKVMADEEISQLTPK